MLIYAESKVFPHKTFILVVSQYDTIARARAQMLHTLYELGKSDHQFRFRFKGVYLRDAYTFEDYKILDNSVIKMVPMTKSRKENFMESFLTSDVSLASAVINSKKGDKEKPVDEIEIALKKEVDTFNRRETLLAAFRVLLWIHFLGTLLSFLTVYWYAGIWTGILMLYGFYYCPNYTRLGGYVGSMTISNEYFLVTYGVGVLLNVTASVLMGVFLMFDILKHGCTEFKGDCSHLIVWSVIFYYGQSLFLLASIVVAAALFRNIKIEVGDIIEYYLIQNRDVGKVIKAAQLGRPKERRNAAFELSGLAASGQEAKEKIAAHDGLQVLMNLALCPDEATQEYATEALAELLTMSSIQDQFIEVGGARTLCALLHSHSERLLTEAVMAISYIVADSEKNRHAIVAETGISDLAHSAETGSLQVGRIVAGVFLELAFNADIRSQLASEPIAVTALVRLCRSSDTESQRLALQTLELMAIENADCIVERDDLLEYLVSLPSISDDEQLYLLGGKILLYYTETEETCKRLVEKDGLKDTLLQFAMSPDNVIQNVVAKIILAMVENSSDKQDVLCIGVIEVLAYLHDNCLDRDAWEVAEKAIDLLHGITVTLQRKGMDVMSSEGESSALLKG